MVDDEFVGADSVWQLELMELVAKVKAGCSRPDVIEALLNDEKCFTKNGRLNRSALSRACGLNSATIDSLFEEFRGLVGDGF